MRFYLLYKNHGLYDPVLDDTELTYIPTEEEWQANNNQQNYNENQNYVQINNTKETNPNKTQTKETIDAVYKDQTKICLKDAFSQINIDDLPPTARFKLPLSDDYDPEGKKLSKLQKLYENILKVDLKKVLEQVRPENSQGGFTEVRQGINNEINVNDVFNQNEMTKEYKLIDKNEEFNTTKETAAKIVEKTIRKAQSVTPETKYESKIEFDRKKSKTESKTEISKFEINKSFKESKSTETESKTKLIEDVRQQDSKRNLADKKKTKKVTFQDIKDEEVSSSKETECTESVNTYTDTRLTTEKRKLLTQQDIAETIPPGTVRNRTEIFKKYNVIYDVIKKGDKYEKTDHKERTNFVLKLQQKKLAQQRVYKTGAKTILNIWRATYPPNIKVLLKTFYSKFTKIMITLSKFMKSKPNSYFDKQEVDIYYDLRERDYKNLKEGELIIKNKLSGAKIAQIEGMKPVELTNKMNIVISELQRRSGIEEEFDRRESERTESTEFERTEYNTNEFDNKQYYGYSIPESKIGEEFDEFSSKRDSNFDKNQNNYTYETTKTQSMEIREMRSEKRYSEYKSKKEYNKKEEQEKEPSPCYETYIRDADGNIIYIAIVEAHVYTNKDAIFEEHLRRMSEAKELIERTEVQKESDVIESQDKMNIYVSFDDTRKLSLASPEVIPTEEYSTASDLEHKQIKYIRSATDMEYLSKKIAAQNIIQAIEPLIKMEVEKHASSHRAHVLLEMPVSEVAEQTEIDIKEQQLYFQAQVFVTQRSFMEAEKPDKPIEITEICVEDESEVLDEMKVEKAQTEPIVELPVKTIAETSEVLTHDDQVVEIVVPEPKIIQPIPTVDVTAKSVAITSEILVDEANLKVFEATQAATKTSSTVLEKKSMSAAETVTTLPEYKSESLNIVSEMRKESARFNVRKNIATEILQVSVEEPMNEEIKITEVQRRQSQPLVEESFLNVPEISTTATEETKQYFEIETIAEKQLRTLSEKSHFTVAEALVILPEETTKDILEVKNREEHAKIEIEELKTAEIITVNTAEELRENIEVPQVVGKLPQTLVESCVLTVPEALAVLPEGPKIDYFDIPEVKEKQTRTLLEETKYTVAETVAIIPEEITDEISEIPKATNQQANIDIEEFKATEIIVASTEEPLPENLEVPKIVEKIPQISLETTFLSVSEAIAVLPSGPKDGTLEIEKVTSAQPNVEFEDITATTVIDVVLIEPKEENLEIPEVIGKVPLIEMESPSQTLAEVITVMPEGPKEGDVEIIKAKEEQIKVNFNELHSVEITSVSLGDSIKDNLSLPEPVKKQPLVKVQETKLNIAETFSIIPEEPKDQAFSVTEVKNQEARLNVEEHKAAESKIISFEETVSTLADVPKIEKKQTQTTIVSSPFAIAETVTTSSVESATEVADTQVLLEKSLKSVEKNVNVSLETITPVSHMTVASMEETHDMSAKIKSSSQQAKVALVESTAAMIAETTAVTVAKEESFKGLKRDSKVKITEIPLRIAQEAKSEDIDLNYTVSLPKEQDDEVDEVFADFTLTKQKSPPVEVYAEFEVNENKVEAVDIFESIKLMSKHDYTHGSMDTSYFLTALMEDVEINKKVEEELLQIIQSETVESGEVSYYTFASPTLIPLIQEYMFRLRGPSLRRFQHMEDVFEEATVKLKSKFKSATVQSLDATLTLILQDIAISQLQSEFVDVDESIEYVSEKGVSAQYLDSKTVSRSEAQSVQSEMQSLHTGLAVASAATKQTIETGIDVSVLAIGEEPIVESRRQISTQKKKSKKSSALAVESWETEAESEIDVLAMEQEAMAESSTQKTAMKKTKKSVKSSVMQAELQAGAKSAKLQMIDASHSQTLESEAMHAELNANMDISMQENLSSIDMSQTQAELEMRCKKSKATALSLKSFESDTGSVESEFINGYSASPPFSPPLTPPTPLTDEYVFKLEIPLPHITQYVPRDCSYSPESVKDDIILKCGLIPHIISRIERIIYCPPLPTPPPSPERQIIPIYKKPALKGGSSGYIDASLFKFFC